MIQPKKLVVYAQNIVSNVLIAKHVMFVLIKMLINWSIIFANVSLMESLRRQMDHVHLVIIHVLNALIVLLVFLVNMQIHSYPPLLSFVLVEMD